MRTTCIVMRHPLTGERRETGTGFNWWGSGPARSGLWRTVSGCLPAGLAPGLTDICDEDVLWTALRAHPSMMPLYALICNHYAHAWHRFVLRRNA